VCAACVPISEVEVTYSSESRPLISRGPPTWLMRVSLGRDPETGTGKYHNETIRGSFREAQTYLSTKVQSATSDGFPAPLRSGWTYNWTSGSQRQRSRGCGRRAIAIMKRFCGFIPELSGHTNRLHHSFEDPGAVEGSDEDRLSTFRAVWMTFAITSLAFHCRPSPRVR
jgi:hypothetical protein